MKITGYAATAIGGRETNQDSFLVDNDRGMFAVADGVGGGARGDDASRMAVEGLAEHPMDGTRLKRTVEMLQERVLKEAMDSLGEALMGTTLTILRADGTNLELCHVGDSRCYQFSKGQLNLLTEDHESFDENYQGPVLSSYLGLPPEYYPLRVQEEMLTLHSGDAYLLCSDGLYKQLSEEEMVKTIEAERKQPEVLLQRLIEQAVIAEYSDNVTVVFIEVQ